MPKAFVFHSDCDDQPSLVARVSCQDSEISSILNEAYRQTFTVNTPWWRNPGVHSLFKEDVCRSTRNGDYIVVEGKIFMVTKDGFQELIPSDQLASAITTTLERPDACKALAG